MNQKNQRNSSKIAENIEQNFNTLSEPKGHEDHEDKENHLDHLNITMTNDQRLIAIQTCLSYAIYEANVYWQRNIIYLTINSIMLGILGAFSKNLENVYMLALGCFGVFLNWSWVYVNKYSKFLAEKWREDARAMARESPEISEYMRALVKKPRIEVPPGKKPSQVMNRLSASFRVLWIVVSLYGLYAVIPEVLTFFGKLQFSVIINKP